MQVTEVKRKVSGELGQMVESPYGTEDCLEKKAKMFSFEELMTLLGA